MDRYTYLLLGVLLLVPLAGILLVRKDLAGTAVKLGMIGGAAGLVAELFYFRDYWRPPSLAGTARISIEDFLFGFAITALCFVACPWLLKATLSAAPTFPRRYKLYGIFFAGDVLALLLFDVLSPRFWDRYWLLHGTTYGITVLGNIPLTELLWYLSWAVFAGISYPFVSGKALLRRPK